jgi:phosphotransferase system enzyme I (PtsP)
MLDTLRHIIQEVNGASDLGEALQIIVQRVKKTVKTDACSVYLTDFEQRIHVLRATDGLRPESVGKVSLPLHRGLIGLVCERAEPVNLDDAPAHPRYMFTAETGETLYHGFLGAPIILNRKVLGVLVVRQREHRQFDENEEAFLVTLAAQLAGAITHAQASGELLALQQQKEAPTRFLKGLPGAGGVALGEAVVVYPPADLNAIPDRPIQDPEQGVAAFREAVDKVRDNLRTLEKRLEGDLPPEDQALFQAWILMLEGESLVVPVIDRIREGNWAPGALHHTIEEHARVFENMDDPYLRERSSDVRDLGRRILMYLQQDTPSVISYPEQTILVGDEVSAVQLAEVPVDRLAGVVSAQGSSSSHVAILARALGVPAVMGVVAMPASRMDRQRIILDGYRGRVYVSPAPSVLEEYERLAQEDRELSTEMEGLRGLPAEMVDGQRVSLYLNTGLVSEMSTLGMDESQGVGLYRTELPFMVRDRFPSESVQIANYRNVLNTFAPRPVILRTLDVGGDKPLPYFPIEESNPFLGWRGIRISLDHPEIFLTQVRAMLRAAIDFNNLRIMLPMICSVSEVDELKQLIQRAHDELKEDGYEVTMPRIGVMVEVPAAVYQAEELARRVDFLSVGTNDLTQYILAVDRNNPRVAEIYDDLHPAVLRAVDQVVERAAVYNRPVSICGELAGNPLATALLLGMGVDSLSMSASSLLRVKWVVRNLSRSRSRELLRAALQMEEARAVRRLMQEALEEMGLGGLVRLGK